MPYILKYAAKYFVKVNKLFGGCMKIIYSVIMGKCPAALTNILMCVCVF